MKPPVAAKKPRELTIHGDTRIDNYYWLRERENPEGDTDVFGQMLDSLGSLEAGQIQVNVDTWGNQSHPTVAVAQNGAFTVSWQGPSLGDEFGVSRERVRQIEKRLLKKLKEFLHKELGDTVVEVYETE